MTDAEKRVAELLDRWMASIELHRRYLKLDDSAYARAEKWPKHQRPTAWVVDLARQRLEQLRAQLSRRQAAGDVDFAEALELMSFLTGLLGSEHLERFIPLASGKPPDPGMSATVEQPRVRPSRSRTGASGLQRHLGTGSRSTPAQRTGTPRTAANAPARSSAPPSPGSSRNGASSKPRTGERTATAPLAARQAAAEAPARRPAKDAPAAAPAAAPAPPPAPDARSKQVIADAVRMLDWGREWPALAGLIARMADRPGETEVWKILRTYRREIMSRTRRPAV